MSSCEAVAPGARNPQRLHAVKGRVILAVKVRYGIYDVIKVDKNNSNGGFDSTVSRVSYSP